MSDDAAFSPALAKLGRSLQPGNGDGDSPTAPSAPSPAERRACILTLLRILDNILEDRRACRADGGGDDGARSHNPKLRKIKVGRPSGAFWKRAGRWDGSVAFLAACGFRRHGGGAASEVLRLAPDDEDADRLRRGRGAVAGLATGPLGMAAGSLPPCGGGPPAKGVGGRGTEEGREGGSVVAAATGGRAPAASSEGKSSRVKSARGVSSAATVVLAKADETDIEKSSSVITASKEAANSKKVPPVSKPVCSGKKEEKGSMETASSAKVSNESLSAATGTTEVVKPYRSVDVGDTSSQNNVIVEKEGTTVKRSTIKQQPQSPAPPPHSSSLLSLEQIKSLAQSERDDAKAQAHKLSVTAAAKGSINHAGRDKLSMSGIRRMSPVRNASTQQSQSTAPPSSLSLEQIKSLAQAERDDVKAQAHQLSVTAAPEGPMKNTGKTKLSMAGIRKASFGRKPAHDKMSKETGSTTRASAASPNIQDGSLPAANATNNVTKLRTSVNVCDISSRNSAMSEKDASESKRHTSEQYTKSPAPLSHSSPLSLERMKSLAQSERDDTKVQANKLEQEERAAAAVPQKPENAQDGDSDEKKLENSAVTVEAKAGATMGGEGPVSTRVEDDDLLDEIEQELNDEFFSHMETKEDTEKAKDKREPSLVEKGAVVTGSSSVAATLAEQSVPKSNGKHRMLDGGQLERHLVEENRESTVLAEEKNSDAKYNDTGKEPPLQLPGAIEELVEYPVSLEDHASVATMSVSTCGYSETPTDLLCKLEAEDRMTHAKNSVAPCFKPVPFAGSNHLHQTQCTEQVTSNEYSMLERETYSAEDLLYNGSMLKRETCNAEVLHSTSAVACVPDNNEEQQELDVSNDVTSLQHKPQINNREDGYDGAAPPPLSDSGNDDGYADLFCDIDLPEGELDGNEDVVRFRQGFAACHTSLLSLWSPIATNGHHCDTRSSSVDRTVVTPTGGLTYLHRWNDRDVVHGTSLDLRTCAEEEKPVILVPLHFVYMIWARVLGLSKNDEADSPASQAGKIYSWVVSNHPKLSALDGVLVAPPLLSQGPDSPAELKSLPKATVGVCNYVCGALCQIGLVQIYETGEAPSPQREEPEALFLAVERGVFENCLQKKREISNDTALIRECHGILARAVYPRINEFGNGSDDVDDRTVLRNNKGCSFLVWHSCQYAARHLLASGRFEDARSLLSNSKFIRLRLDSTGLLEGSRAHCRDLARLAECISESVEEWQRKQLQVTNSKQSSPNGALAANKYSQDLAKWKEEHFNILCSISMVLREKAGEVAATSCGRGKHDGEINQRQLQRDIGDALQTIGESIGDIKMYRAQEMEHYEEALKLKSEAFGDDQNHESIADILVSFLQARKRASFLSSFL